MAYTYDYPDMQAIADRQQRSERSWPLQWLLLFLFLLVGFIIIAAAYLFNLPEKAKTLLVLALQNLIPFAAATAITALVARSMTSRRTIADTLYLNRAPSWRWVAVVVVTWLVMLPAMNALVAWNESVSLPPSMKGLEDSLRVSEDAARAITQSLLNTSDPAMMLLLVVVVGVLTGFGEEMFFRAGMLRPMVEQRVNAHVAIWVVAFIFSAFHLQFFGFVPRMLLGAWLGYLMLWSRSLWVPIIAHAVNNSAVVIASFLANRHITDTNALDNIGTVKPGEFPWLATISALAWLVLAVAIAKKSKKIETTANND